MDLKFVIKKDLSHAPADKPENKSDL